MPAPVNVEVDDRAVRVALQRLQGAGERAVHDALELSALRIEGQLKLTLSTRWGARSGREYPRQHGRKVHVASAPGEPPAPDTGNLQNSVSHSITGTQAEIGVVASRAAYAAFLAPTRPFITIAWEAAKGDVEQIVADALRRAVSQA